MDLNSDGSIGIKKKIHSQIEVLSKNDEAKVDYVWREDQRCVSSITSINNQKCLKMDESNKLLITNVVNEYDYLYIRFQRFSISFLKLLKSFSKKSKIFLEIPTYPFIKEDIYSLKDVFSNKRIVDTLKMINKIICNWFLPQFAKKNIAYIVTYSDDKKIWGLPTLNISNGIPIYEFSGNNCCIDNKIHILCVSSCMRWHGYDRAILGLRDYYIDNPKEEVVLEIVGIGPEIPEYRRMISEYNLGKYVVLHGKVVGEDLNKIYETADIALDAMGRHRVGVYYNSSLKGKEYLERGVPIVSGVKTELDSLENFPFYFRVPADDSPIDIKEILYFSHKIRQISNYKRIMHEFAEHNFSYSIAMKKVKDKME